MANVNFNVSASNWQRINIPNPPAQLFQLLDNRRIYFIRPLNEGLYRRDYIVRYTPTPSHPYLFKILYKREKRNGSGLIYKPWLKYGVPMHGFPNFREDFPENYNFRVADSNYLDMSSQIFDLGEAGQQISEFVTPDQVTNTPVQVTNVNAGPSEACIAALECPVCMQKYSNYRQPTTLPCGHSLCMNDAARVNSICPICRAPFNLVNQQITISLRDASLACAPGPDRGGRRRRHKTKKGKREKKFKKSKKSRK